MKSVSTKVSALALLLAITIIGGGAVSAQQNMDREEFLNSLTDDQQAVLEEAKELRETGDHESAKALIEAAGIELPERKGFKARVNNFFQNLSEEDQAVVEQARELREAGNHDEAKSLLEEAGIQPPHRSQKGERGEGNSEQREAVKAAIQAGDFAAFQEVAGETRFGGQITEENFGTLGQIHELREAGDREGARALAEEMGLERPQAKRFFRGNGDCAHNQEA